MEPDRGADVRCPAAPGEGPAGVPASSDPRPPGILVTAPGYQPPPAPPPHDWSRYDLDQIWAMLSAHSEASADIASDMWRRIGELCYVESAQLEQALNKLRETWPLTQPASIMFNAWGMKLIDA